MQGIFPSIYIHSHSPQQAAGNALAGHSRKRISVFLIFRVIWIGAEGEQVAAAISPCTDGIGEESPDSTGQGAP